MSKAVTCKTIWAFQVDQFALRISARSFWSQDGYAATLLSNSLYVTEAIGLISKIANRFHNLYWSQTHMADIQTAGMAKPDAGWE